MKAHVLRGSKQEIAEGVVRMSGNVREAIVFVEEASDVTTSPPRPESPPATVEEMFAEMEPYTVDVPEFDDSREAIYRRMDGE